MDESTLNELIRSQYAFAEDAIMSGAITFDEFLQWVDFLVGQYDNLPTFIFDLMDTKTLSDTRSVIPRHCYSGLSSKESDVLWGIALKRFPDMDIDEMSITPKTALKRLEQYPHVVERFKKTFPFIKLDF